MPNTAEFNMAVLWWEHGVCGVCVCEANAFRKNLYRRFDEGQFTNVGCKTNMLEHWVIVGLVKNRSLDDDRSGGRLDGMDWFGEG